MTLDFLLQYQVEQDYDFVYVQASRDGGATFETSHSSRVPAVVSFEAVSLDLTPFLSSPLNLVVRFRFMSDLSVSDEDGGNPSDGAACRLDQVAVTGFGTDDFETGNDGWIPSEPQPLAAAFRLELNPPQDFPPIPPASLTGQSWVAYDPRRVFFLLAG